MAKQSQLMASFFSTQKSLQHYLNGNQTQKENTYKIFKKSKSQIIFQIDQKSIQPHRKAKRS